MYTRLNTVILYQEQHQQLVERLDNPFDGQDGDGQDGEGNHGADAGAGDDVADVEVPEAPETPQYSGEDPAALVDDSKCLLKAKSISLELCHLGRVKRLENVASVRRNDHYVDVIFPHFLKEC